MEQRAITQMEKSKKMTKAEKKFRQAEAVYAQAVKDEKERVRRIQDRHKYMMGGCVLKYFPEGYNAYEFDDQIDEGKAFDWGKIAREYAI